MNEHRRHRGSIPYLGWRAHEGGVVGEVELDQVGQHAELHAPKSSAWPHHQTREYLQQTANISTCGERWTSLLSMAERALSRVSEARAGGSVERRLSLRPSSVRDPSTVIPSAPRPRQASPEERRRRTRRERDGAKEEDTSVSAKRHRNIAQSMWRVEPGRMRRELPVMLREVRMGMRITAEGRNQSAITLRSSAPHARACQRHTPRLVPCAAS